MTSHLCIGQCKFAMDDWNVRRLQDGQLITLRGFGVRYLEELRKMSESPDPVSCLTMSDGDVYDSWAGNVDLVSHGTSKMFDDGDVVVIQIRRV